MFSFRFAAFTCFVAPWLLAGEGRAAADYIAVSPRELKEAYGDAIAERAFSEELTALRTARIKESLSLLPKGYCPDSPKFVIRDLYPYEIQPGDIAWIERYEVACKRTLRRAIFILKDGSGFVAAPMAPGETLASIPLQIDASQLTRTVALARRGGACENASIVDTALHERPAAIGESWKERWSVHACGEVVDIDVVFTPSPLGGTQIKLLGE